MELRQLQYFVAVAEEASFTRAAERVHVAQSGVSAQVRRLERELGQRLFERSARTVRLTEVGAAVLPHARAALEAAAGARLTVEEHAGLLRGRVAVGMVIACGILDLPSLLDTFHRAHPGVEITLSEDNSDKLLGALGDGRLDLALVGLADPPPRNVETQVLIDDELVAAVAHSDLLATRSGITVSGLRDRPLVSLPRGTGVRSALDDACARAGVQPLIAFEASDLRMVAELAIRGLGVAILPESVAAARSGELAALRLTRPRSRSRIELAWRADASPSPAASALIAHARGMLSPA